jgi:hypothetical protein
LQKLADQKIFDSLDYDPVGARERKRVITGKKVEGRSHAEQNPELVALVRQLRRRRPKGGQ